MNFVRSELEKAGANYRFLDHRDIFCSDIEYVYNENGHSSTIIRSPRVTIDLDEVKAVYTRPYDFMDYPEMKGKTSEDPLARKATGFEYQMMTCLDSSDALIINKSEPSATNNSKPYQLSVIKELGLKIPVTFITNEVTSARKFIDDNIDCVYKSISGVRSIVKKVSDSHNEYLDDVKWCPTLFQEALPGVNYRVHVIQNEVYSVRIDSDTLDYRYGKTSMIAEELPSEINLKCRELTALLGLHFSGIDLIRTPGDEWYFLEVNPSPGYTYFQVNGGLPISSALARALIAADNA